MKKRLQKKENKSNVFVCFETEPVSILVLDAQLDD